MTKTVLITNLKEIKAVKVSCVKCGFLIQFPITHGYQKVKQCINCSTPIPANEISVLMDSIKLLQSLIDKKGDFADINIEFETEEK